MSCVISASRRTDIPAFYSDWFITRLREGRVVVRQPYSGKYFSVSLRPEEVNAVVFWSKNYAPLLGKLDQVERRTRNLFFHFTITGNRELENNVPDRQDAVRDYRFLAKRYTSAHVVWRYDPICITDKLSFETLEERFIHLAELLKGFADQCIISFVHPYRKVLVNMADYTDHRLLDVPLEQKKEYAGRLARLASRYGIRLSACCNDHLVSGPVTKAACIDGRYLSGLFAADLDTRPASTRTECACTRSIDIGAYDTCAHGCAYCYANTDKERAEAAQRRHDPAGNSLGRQVPEEMIGQGDQRDRMRPQTTLPFLD